MGGRLSDEMTLNGWKMTDLEELASLVGEGQTDKRRTSDE